jgi:hypothetical protein
MGGLKPLKGRLLSAKFGRYAPDTDAFLAVEKITL